jgi:D-galactose 1-dehydrogenase
VTATEPVRLAIIGVGKIARDQHLPSIAKNGGFELVAAVSRNAEVEGVDNFGDIDAMLKARPDVSAVALCMPPQARFEAAWRALDAGKHVLLEKPPGATIAEVEALKALAAKKRLTLFATWHSRFAPAVAEAKAWLSRRQIVSVGIVWKEDVRRWHPGQEWIWEPGGAGIFDPGINALSILTEIMPHDFHVREAELDYPDGRQAPIAARLRFRDAAGTPISAEFDWRQTGPQTWDITVETDTGVMVLSSGGAVMEFDGKVLNQPPEAEYPAVYARFAELIAAGESDVDLRPLVHVADAFMLGRRIVSEPFTS